MKRRHEVREIADTINYIDEEIKKAECEIDKMDEDKVDKNCLGYGYLQGRFETLHCLKDFILEEQR